MFEILLLVCVNNNNCEASTSEEVSSELICNLRGEETLAKIEESFPGLYATYLCLPVEEST